MLLLTSLLFTALASGAPPPYRYQASEPRWISPENRDAGQGHGALENRGAKGHAFDTMPAHGAFTLGVAHGPGVIRRLWLTVDERAPAMLRSLRLEIYWDGADTPAVSTPLGDFFGYDTGQEFAFENALFSSPEGRSFVATVPMPFHRSARFVLYNDSDKPLSHLFYDIDYNRQPVSAEALYFHANWRHVHRTRLGHAFRVLPPVRGRGRFLGASIAVIANPVYGKTWWGEGEMQLFLDGDTRHPTLVGTGTEDYLGSGWGLGHYVQRDEGTPIADEKRGVWLFYRYHLPDPIFFAHGCEVRLQQIGGAPKAQVRALAAKGAPLLPISVDGGDRAHFAKLLDGHAPRKLGAPNLPDGWTNFYRSDDLTATVYYYLDKPGAAIDPRLPPARQRVEALPRPAHRDGDPAAPAAGL